MSALIEVKNVYKDYQDQNRQTSRVLENISLEIGEGQFLAILGPSGSGKSTLLRIIAGLIPASSGSLTYLGNVVDSVNPGVAMVFQSFALFPWLTVLENVLLGLETQPFSAEEKNDAALKIIDAVGLDGFENAYPKELSGGMRQRVGIGRALVGKPAVLLMDEPFSALDVLTAENLRRDLLELWLDKKMPIKSIILVTHSIEEAVYMADRAVILSSGPARIARDIPIELPYWRDKKTPEFSALVDEIYSIMTNREISDPAQHLQRPQKTRLLPAVSAGALTGFLELLEDLNERTDLYKLADRFVMDTEDFLPIVELASLLGFAKVVAGDIELTAEGTTFARASVLERKNLFREQLLQHIPFISQMITILQSKTNKKMNIEFFENLLAATFGEEVAKTQVQLVVGWGRYAEILSYEQKTDQVCLESELTGE